MFAKKTDAKKQRDMERKTRDDYRNFGKAYYHFNLERLEGRNIFTRPEDYRIGMATVALLTLKYNVQIFAFELLPNHAHIVLYSDGPTCLEMFAYIKRRLSKMLADKGEAPLPENYGFRLTPIEDKETLIIQILYTVRNHYEKNFCTPDTYEWGTGYLYFSGISNSIRGQKVSTMSKAEVRRLTGSKEELPGEWEIHSELGVLPRNFVRSDKVMQLFSSAKQYMTRLVKEYEAMVKIATELGETVDFSEEEVQDIVNSYLRSTYPGRLFKSLTQEEKIKSAVQVNDRFGLTPRQLSKALWMSELGISQAIRSKDYGIKK